MPGHTLLIEEQIVALVPAAGQGERLGLGPKAILKLGQMTLVEHVVASLEKCISRILVGVPADQVVYFQSCLGARAVVLSGAATRQLTIQKLLEHSTESLIVIHDGNRPFASGDLLEKVVTAGREHGAAVPFVPSHNPVARVENGRIAESYNGFQMMLSQTPQAYRREVLAAAYAHAAAHNVETQATWQLVGLAGHAVKAVAGEERNIKITTLYDWEVAQKII